MLSSVTTVKLLLVPLPCTGILIIGAEVPPNTVVLNTASANIAGGLIVPKRKLVVGWGTSWLLKSYLIWSSGVTTPSAATDTLS